MNHKILGGPALPGRPDHSHLAGRSLELIRDDTKFAIKQWAPFDRI